MSLIPWILLGIICLEHLIFIPKLIKKFGGTVWHGYVPGLNALAILKMNGRPWYWALFLFVPGVNLIMLTIMHVELGIVFGKRTTKDQYLMGALPWVGLPQLANSDAEYVGPRVWTKVKKGPIREWGEAILWAVVVASIFRTYSFETFTIPTGSMEGSMLVGDYLIVNKMTYGAKLPETPFAVPLVHNVLPGTMTPSYTSWFSLPYYRLPGFRDVERGDAVVFNFPPGDTIIVDPVYAGHDYYGIIRSQALSSANGDLVKFSEDPEKYISSIRNQARRRFGLMQRPIDKKENYVKRCIGLPGETLQIIDRQVHINGVAIANPENLQYEYNVNFDSRREAVSAYQSLGLTKEDLAVKSDGRVSSSTMSIDEYIIHFCVSESGVDLTIALTKSEVELLKNSGAANSVELLKEEDKNGGYKRTLRMFPNVYDEEFNEWTPDDLGPIYIPQADSTVELTERNMHLYRRVISVYEGHELEETENGIFIDGELATEYTFEQNYYWMMGDNRHRSADSRMWGFVPFDHIVGRASFIWFSKMNSAQHGESGIRWDRMFKSVK